jgi:LPS-assembly lipoprotein
MRAPARSASLPPGMTTRRSAILLLLGGALPALAGCGFSPLYGRAENGSVSAELAKIKVKPIPNRSGQILRNYLIDMLAPGGGLASGGYTLDVRLNEPRLQDQGISRSESVLRYSYSANASFQLVDPRGIVIVRGSSGNSSSFAVTNSEYSNIAGQSDARDRVMEAIAADFRTQIATHFRARLTRAS